MNKTLRNIKLTIEYDGTKYHGWQFQNNAVTVQNLICNAIDELTHEKCALIGASRTDAGVHAYGQVANFMTSSSIPACRFSYAINRILPEDIVIVNSQGVDMNFHSQFSSIGKKYRYLIINSPFRSAIYKDKAYHISHELDLDAMRIAFKYFLGTHDFSSFRATGTIVKSSIRTINNVSISKTENIFCFEIEGDGFLYNMIRIIVGTLIDVGMGKTDPLSIPDIIEAKNRKLSGKTVPGHGLYLVEVYY